MLSRDSMIATIPEGMSYAQAVPVLGGGVTAAKILDKGNIHAGQKVLIYGASGNVGTMPFRLPNTWEQLLQEYAVRGTWKW